MIPAKARPLPLPPNSAAFLNPIIEQIKPTSAKKKENINPTIAIVFD